MQKFNRFLKEKNIEVVMLTGDNEQVASKIATSLGIENILQNKHQFQKLNI